MSSSTSSSTKPKVLVIALDCKDMVQEISKHLWAALTEHSDFTITDSRDDALSRIKSTDSPPLHAIILADPAVVNEEENASLKTAVFDYAKSGGRVVMACVFSSFIGPPSFDKFMKKDLHFRWRFGDYHRTDNHLNPRGTNLCLKPKLAATYSMKAVSLKGVREDEKIYRPTAGSRIQSAVFPPDKIDDLKQAAVAVGKFGEGWVGWVGDVNSEEPSTDVILAMCGLRDEKACFTCGKDGKMRQCAKCTKARYCSTECQKTDWKNHKVVCARSEGSDA